MSVIRPRTQRPTPADILKIVESGGPLLRGHQLMCPGCEQVVDVLDYLVLEYSERYADQVVVPLKCRRCRHVFALKP